MIINSLLTYVPATVDVDLGNGVSTSIYLLINLPNRIVLVPDAEQYKQVENDYEDFVTKVWQVLDGVMVPSNYKPAQPPKEVLEALVATRNAAQERTKELTKTTSQGSIENAL